MDSGNVDRHGFTHTLFDVFLLAKAHLNEPEMTGREITDQIIADLESSVEAQNNTRSNDEIMNAITAEAYDQSRPSTHSIPETWIALSCEISLPGFAITLVHLVNSIVPVVEIGSNDRLTIRELLHLFKENRDRVAEVIQQIKDNTSLMYFSGNSSEPLFDFLMDRVKVVHDEAEQIRRAYQAYLS